MCTCLGWQNQINSKIYVLGVVIVSSSIKIPKYASTGVSICETPLPAPKVVQDGSAGKAVGERLALLAAPQIAEDCATRQAISKGLALLPAPQIAQNGSAGHSIGECHLPLCSPKVAQNCTAGEAVREGLLSLSAAPKVVEDCATGRAIGDAKKLCFDGRSIGK